MTLYRPSPTPLQPILVMLVWRGGKRFERALESLRNAESFFSRIVISITSDYDSADVQIARSYVASLHEQGGVSKAEIVCTGRELPTMQHQEFWIRYLLSSGANSTDWIYWLAYDDEIRLRGLRQITDTDKNWPLISGTAYFGPWAMRHEAGDALWNGDLNEPIEIWTGMPRTSSTVDPIDWMCLQVVAPTYLQMSGSVVSLGAHQSLALCWPRKGNPMRIEAATALMPEVSCVSEFSSPIVRIYGRPNSDRANYGNTARRSDFHLALTVGLRVMRHPVRCWRPAMRLFKGVVSRLKMQVQGRNLPEESRIVIGTCPP